MGELFQEQTDVGRLYHFQKLVGSIVLKTAYGCSSIVECDALFGEEVYQRFLVEGFFAGQEEMLLIVEEEEAEDAPHVVLQVRIKEIHAPTLPLRWKTAQHQQGCVAGQKRF